MSSIRFAVLGFVSAVLLNLPRQVTASATSLGDLPLQIQTVIGTGLSENSGDGGLAVDASLFGLEAISVDPTYGHVYMSVYTKVRMSNVFTNEISTIAGTGEAGTEGDGGQATSATFLNKYCVFADTAGRIYLPIWQDSKIRVVDTKSGVVDLFAGTGTPPSFHHNGDGGHATSAHFVSPTDLWADTGGNVYLSDFVANNIRFINAATNTISTIAGSIDTISGESNNILFSTLVLHHVLQVLVVMEAPPLLLICTRLSGCGATQTTETCTSLLRETVQCGVWIWLAELCMRSQEHLEVLGRLEMEASPHLRCSAIPKICGWTVREMYLSWSLRVATRLCAKWMSTVSFLVSLEVARVAGVATVDRLC